MGTVKLIAKASYAYAGQALSVGDVFEASERDAQILKVTGRADDAPTLRKTSRKDLTADSGTSEVKIDRRTREYRRRDLVPEP